MAEHTIQFVSPRRFYDTATVAETHRRLPAEGHNISENALHGLVDSKKCLWRVIEKYFGEKPQRSTLHPPPRR